MAPRPAAAQRAEAAVAGRAVGVVRGRRVGVGVGGRRVGRARRVHLAVDLGRAEQAQADEADDGHRPEHERPAARAAAREERGGHDGHVRERLHQQRAVHDGAKELERSAVGDALAPDAPELDAEGADDDPPAGAGERRGA